MYTITVQCLQSVLPLKGEKNKSRVRRASHTIITVGSRVHIFYSNKKICAVYVVYLEVHQVHSFYSSRRPRGKNVGQVALYKREINYKIQCYTL